MTFGFNLPQSLRSTASGAALALALSGTAGADVTNEQVWADMKSYMEGMGYETAGTETVDGDTLTVTDIKMTVDISPVEGQSSNAAFEMERLAFTNNGDGTVTVELPERMPLSFSSNFDGKATSSGKMSISQSGANLIVSGDPDDMTYDYAADALTVSLDEIDVEGEDVPADMMKASVTMNGVKSSTQMAVGDLRTIKQNVTAASMSYDVNIDVPEGPDAGRVAINGTLNDVKVASDGTIPAEFAGADISAMMAAGMNGTGSITFGAGSTVIDADTPDGATSGKSSSNGGMLEFAINSDGVMYAGEVNEIAAEMQTPDFPFPIAYQMAKGAFNLKFPMTPGEEEQDFAFGFTMGDFTISEMIWGLFDPAGQLPRDPATIAIDLTGKAKLLVDIFDPAEAAAMEAGVAPGEINALDINNLEVSAVGASLTGNGAVTFDNSDMQTVPGMPKPTGAIDLRLEGANQLLDTLVQMGLLPEDQAMGARMMMGLFGVPEGDDALTSKIEFTEEGHILANGQRLQ